MSNLTASHEQIEAYMASVLSSDQLVELRALNVPTNMGPRTFSGFFNDHAKLAHAAANLSDLGSSGVYFTLNPLKTLSLPKSFSGVQRLYAYFTYFHFCR